MTIFAWWVGGMIKIKVASHHLPTFLSSLFWSVTYFLISRFIPSMPQKVFKAPPDRYVDGKLIKK